MTNIAETKAESLKRRRDAVDRLLLSELCGGPRLTREVVRKSDAAGISRRILSGARRRLGIRYYHDSGDWYWDLPR